MNPSSEENEGPSKDILKAMERMSKLLKGAFPDNEVKHDLGGGLNRASNPGSFSFFIPDTSEGKFVKKQRTNPGCGDPNCVACNAANAMAPDVAMTEDEILDTVCAYLPSLVNPHQIKATFFLKHISKPHAVRDSDISLWLDPSWGVHMFHRVQTRFVQEDLVFNKGDKLVVVSTHTEGIQIMAYAVKSTKNKPADDDYGVTCVFTGGVSLTAECVLQDIKPNIGNIFEQVPVEAQPDVDPSLQELLDDPEYKHVAYALE
jgi:hypothetical protein